MTAVSHLICEEAIDARRNAEAQQRLQGLVASSTPYRKDLK